MNESMKSAEAPQPVFLAACLIFLQTYPGKKALLGISRYHIMVATAPADGLEAGAVADTIQLYVFPSSSRTAIDARNEIHTKFFVR